MSTPSVREAVDIFIAAIENEYRDSVQNILTVTERNTRLEAENAAMGGILAAIVMNEMKPKEVDAMVRSLPKDLKKYVHFVEEKREDKEQIQKLLNELGDYRKAFEDLYTVSIVKMPFFNVPAGEVRAWIQSVAQAGIQYRRLFERMK